MAIMNEQLHERFASNMGFLSPTECLYPRNRKMPCRVGRSVSAMNLVRTKLSSIEEVAGQPLTSVKGELGPWALLLMMGGERALEDVLI